MNTLELMSHLRSLDVKLSVNGERLECDAPSGALTKTLKLEIAKRKLEILKFLKNISTSSAQQPILPVSREETLPLSFAQQRLWNLDQLEPGSSVYNLPVAFRFKGFLNLALLEKSLREIVQRHEILRTTFKAVDRQTFQVISPEIPSILSVADLREIPQLEREVHAKQLITEEAVRPFSLTQGPLLRVKLLRLAEEEYVFLLVMHHIISDGWSFKVFFSELTAFYKAFYADELPSLSNLPIQYADFAHWQQQWLSGEVLESQLEYWRQELEGNPEALQLPIDRSRALLKTYQGARQSLVVNQKLTEALKLLSRQQGVSIFMTLMAAFKALLHRYTGQKDIIICSPVACRDRIETEDLIGYFNNIVLMRTDLSEDPSFRELLNQVRKVASGAYDHQDVPFQKIAELPNLVSTPLSRAMLVLQNTSTQPPDLEGINVSSFDVGNGSANFDLSLSMEEQGGELRGVIDYKTDLFNTDTIEQIIRNFQSLLESIVVNIEQKLSDLPLLTETNSGQLFDKTGYLNGSDIEEKESRQTFVAPRNQLELQLAEIWEQVFGIEPIGIRDNFFELGGHSILAVRLFEQIEKAFNKNLPLATLFEAPTIEQLASLMQPSQKPTAFDSLVLIKPGKYEQPLFFVHDADGETMLYRNLAHHLESERSVYGLRPCSENGYPILHTRVSEMVPHYIAKMRTVQPEGPYLLGGLCAGGNLAFEIALQLQAQGEKVALVAIMDAIDVQAPINRQTNNKRLSSFSQILSQSQQLRGQERLTYILNQAKEKLINLITYESRIRIENILNKFKVILYRYYLDQGYPLPQFLRNLSIRTILKFEAQTYVPQQVYQGQLTLLRSTKAVVTDDPSIDDEPYSNLTNDPLLGWGKRATGGVKVHDIPGGHSSMLQEPNVRVMAEKLQAGINTALAREYSTHQR